MGHFILTFGTDAGRSRNLRVNHAKTTLTDANVIDIMNRIIATVALAATSTGVVATRRGAELVEQTVTPIVLP